MGRPDDVITHVARAHGAWQRWRPHRWVLECWAAIERSDQKTAREVVEAAWLESGGRERREEWLVSPPAVNPERSQLLHAEFLLLMAGEVPTEAVVVAQALVQLDEHVGERFDVSFSKTLLARALIAAGDHQGAMEVLAATEKLLEGSPYPYLLASVIELRAMLETDVRVASELFTSAAQDFERVANALDQARCLRLAAESLRELGEKEHALDRLRRALELASNSGARAEQNRVESVMRALGARPRAGRPRGRKPEKGLSPREAEVVVMVAAGSSNGEIGQRLFLSDRTVQDHISHALKKLGLTSRAALASWAVKQGMI
jgi:DNA-binding NarL/FixJ family response regulator